MKAILKMSEPLLISYGQTIFLQVLALVLIAAGLALVLLGCLLRRRTHTAGGKTAFNGIAAVSLLGDRSNQQDFFLFPQGENYQQGRLAVVCDGMGGLSGGEQASRVCAQKIFSGFYSRPVQDNVCERLKALAEEADSEVSSLKDANGNLLRSGTTLVAAVVKDGKAYWVSVGDSRIYLYQQGRIIQLTRDHNLRMNLESRLAAGLITREQMAAVPKQEALTSFIGKGRELIIDTGELEFTGEDGSLLLLCSDGLYKSLSDMQIAELVQKNIKNVQRLPEIIANTALKTGNRKHDNTTVLVIGR